MFDLKANNRTCTRGREAYYPLHNHADLPWTVSNKYTSERESRCLLNTAGQNALCMSSYETMQATKMCAPQLRQSTAGPSTVEKLTLET